MKIVLALILMGMSSLLFAEMVTSPISLAKIVYLAEEGTLVKKGEVLYKLSDWFKKNRIQKAKLELAKCRANLKDKKKDVARARKLYQKKAISLAAQEDTIVEYYKCEYGVVKANLKVKQLELALKSYVFKAPYDCRVIKNILCLYSGLDNGTKIMEIQSADGPVPPPPPDKNMLLTSYIKGDSITYLPKEGQIVKKGKALIKFETADIEFKIKSYEYSLKEAEECMKDAKTDIDRSKILRERNIISLSEYDNIGYLYTRGVLTVEMIKLDVAYYKRFRDVYVIPAAYDLRVVKRLVSLGSGLKLGGKVLKIKNL